MVFFFIVETLLVWICANYLILSIYFSISIFLASKESVKDFKLYPSLNEPILADETLY